MSNTGLICTEYIWSSQGFSWKWILEFSS